MSQAADGDLGAHQTGGQMNVGLEVWSTDDHGCMLAGNGTTVRLARVTDYVRSPHTVLGREVGSAADAAAALTEVGPIAR